MGAVALLSPNEVQDTPDVALPATRLSSSISTAPLFAAVDTTPPGESASQVHRTVTTRRRRRRRDETQAAVNPPYGFASKWLSSSPQPLRCIDLHFNTALTNALAFSPDGSFLVSGGDDNCVRMWNIREILGGGNVNSEPIQMETEHGDDGVACVTVTPNSRSIFSGGSKDKTVLIHDIQT